MSQRTQWLLYGATGYTGRQIAERALAQGSRPVLAGRNAAEGQALADQLGLEWRTIDLNDTAQLHQQVAQFSAVLHAAGPFVHTWRPMVDACLAGGTHYLDITGEVPVYEALAGLDAQARAAGVMLLPGCGFDMVPSDCLARQVQRRLPDATHLDIAYSFDGGLSRGTLRSALAAAEPMAQVRQAGALVKLAQPMARVFDFGPGRCGGAAAAYAATFGDLSVAWRTTGIPNIVSYIRPNAAMMALAQITDLGAIDQLPAGPSTEELAAIPSIYLAEARNAAGDAVAMRLVTPQVYTITVMLAATLAEWVHQGTQRPGFQTPAQVFGEDCILRFDGCQWEPWTVSSQEASTA